MLLRLSLSSVFFFFFSLTSTSTFALDTFRQNWSGLDDEKYVQSLVACATTLKELQWSYNVWPKENKTEKPSFNTVVNEVQLYNQVITSLQKQTLLANQFGIEISKEMLQGELDRMARDSKDPRRLKELYASLNNNPTSITECVARPNLVNRLLRNQFSYNQAIHGELNHQAQSELSSYQQTRKPGNSSVDVFITDYVIEKDTESPAAISAATDPFRIELDQQSFDEKHATLINLQAGTSQLQELETAFVYEEVIEQSKTNIKVKSLVWQKDSLNSWITKQNPTIQPSPVSKLQSSFVLTDISGAQAGAVGGPPDTWKELTSTPRSRAFHTAIWTGTEMIVWGGKNGPGFTDRTGGRYNPATGVWTRTSVVGAPLGRSNHTAIWTGTEMIIWGGGVLNSEFDSGGRYNPLTDSWTAMTTSNAPTARAVHSSIWTGTEMIIWGGADNKATNRTFFNSGGRYQPSTDTWTATSTSGAPGARGLHAAVWTGKEMIIWGGGNRSGAGGSLQTFKTGGHYNPGTDTWTATESADSPVERWSHRTVWTGTEMLIWGGSGDNSGGLSSGGLYNPETRIWSATSTTNAPVIGGTAVWTGTEMIIWVVGFTSTGARYNPVSDIWVSTTESNAPSGRQTASAVWTGTEMIIFGGNVSTTQLNSGGRYNPINDNWVSTTTSNTQTLTARNLHSAVWTGSEMLVWGGMDEITGIINSGSRYDPVTDYWREMTVSGAPTARAFHTAAWTGTEMLVWGGRNGPDLATGGIYDPGLDSWSAMTTSNAPTARTAHSSIWTGTEMIIWGGNDGAVADTGARYDPDLNSWTPVTTTDAPGARESHSAVWTDTEMIVWGGSDTDTGGRYNPTSNTWVATETLDAPTPRSSHTAIWSGTEMLVWGGRDAGDIPLDSGGRYDPDTGIWQAIANPLDDGNAPTGRFLHTAVWTDTEMLIWGGIGDSISNTGGRYDPDTNSWAAITTTDAPFARERHVAVWDGTDMLIWGGDSGIAKTDTGGRYNPGTNKWKTITTTNIHNYTTNHTAVWAGENMIVWGGRAKNFEWTNVGSSYDLSTDSWTPITVENAPAGRGFHKAVWTGAEMIIWGGSASTGFTTGGRYNPVTDSWTDTQTVNAPFWTTTLSVIWTGTEMIIWGGHRQGAAYNQLSNTWTTLSAAPTKLSGHVAVWTGTEMIVWGGKETFGGPTTRGFRYTPSSDSWTEMSTTDAPTARSEVPPVWTDSEMIVWGGWDSVTSSALDTGARYNPSTNTWSPTSAPPISKRHRHSATWTGLEMVVWSGGSPYPRNGARYNPETDAWKLTAVDNAPSSTTTWHEAVFTGTEIVVWAGQTVQFWGEVGIYYPMFEPLPELIFGGPGGSFEQETP